MRSRVALYYKYIQQQTPVHAQHDAGTIAMMEPTRTLIQNKRLLYTSHNPTTIYERKCMPHNIKFATDLVTFYAPEYWGGSGDMSDLEAVLATNGWDPLRF